MAKRKAKRNARMSNAHDGFKISRKPIVRVTAGDGSPDVADSIGLPGVHGRPILFAIARDARTIFASWNIDWRSVFEKATPADRQVHLRLIGAGGAEQKIVTIEPMTLMHYVTTPRTQDSYYVEIGYFHPADRWNSIAMSGEVKMPPQGRSEIADVDLATIPLHLSFQELSNLFGATDDTPLTRSVSEFQKRVLNNHAPDVLSPVETEILHKLNLSLSEIATKQRDFEQSDTEKLARRSGALLRITAMSPSRGFEGNAAS